MIEALTTDQAVQHAVADLEAVSRKDSFGHATTAPHLSPEGARLLLEEMKRLREFEWMYRELQK